MLRTKAIWKWRYNVFETWPQNQSIIWLCAWRPLNLSTHPANSGSHRPFSPENMTFLNCHMITGSKCHVAFSVGPSHPASAPWQVLSAIVLVNVEICFWFVTWSNGWCVRWGCGLSPLIPSHHPARLGGYRPCESGDITFFIFHVTTISKCHLTLWVGSPHPKSLPCQVWSSYALWKWK